MVFLTLLLLAYGMALSESAMAPGIFLIIGLGVAWNARRGARTVGSVQQQRVSHAEMDRGALTFLDFCCLFDVV